MTNKAYRHSGAEIKALDETRVGGYLVRFTSENDRDLHNEWFDKTTDFLIERGYPIKAERMLLEHGLEDFAKVMPIGIIDLVKEDEFGLYIEGKLKTRAEYEQMLKDMVQRKSLMLSPPEISRKAELAEKAIKAIIETGKVGWSSGALPQSVRVNEENGHIDSWAIIEASLTFTPAEPDNEASAIKSALAELETFLSLPSESQDAPKDAQHKEAIADTVIEPSKTLKPISNKGLKTMTPEMIKELIAVLQAMLQEQGAPEEEAMAMAGEVAEEMKAETPEEEQAKAVDEELVKAWMGKAIAKAQAKFAKRAAAVSVAKGLANAAANSYKQNAPVSDSAFSGGYSAGNRGSTISVGNNLKYAHLSASDMALGILMALSPAKSSGSKPHMEDYFSEEYLKTFANKAVKHADSDPYGRNAKSAQHLQMGVQANALIKSVIPFKANELDASNIAGQGDEWVGEWWSTDLWERERFERHYDKLVARGMMVETIPQGADTAHFPTEGSDPTAYVSPQANSVGANGLPETTANFSPFATGKVDCTPLEIKIATSVTVILEEDSVIAIAGQVNRQLNEAALETRDKLLVNGDDSLGTTNINYDGTQVPLGLQRPYYTAADGMRLHGLSNSNALDANNTLSLEQYRLTLAELDGELRQYYDRMVFMIDPTTEMASLAIPEIKTDDVRRSFATVTSGRILNIFGVDVLVNGFIPQTDTDGKVTATGNVANRGTILLVYAPYWGFAYKRNITLETARNIYSGTNDYVMSMRIGMVARGANASALSYNVATTVS